MRSALWLNVLTSNLTFNANFEISFSFITEANAYILFNFVNFFYFTHNELLVETAPVLDNFLSLINAPANDPLSVENIRSVYNYSVPNTKLYYPEAFTASASFMHSDLWFMHILVYQYWLWFVFIFLIIFFFLMFIHTIRWCNMRTRPRRETRGVSRSKCADLITACVPVSWAASIIINETTDAIDYYDGFGTTELVVGIRAYQWGWEYYYPKDLDLQHTLKNNYSLFIGNSLKYETTGSQNLKINNLWKLYQNKTTSSNLLPAELLWLIADNNALLQFQNFNDIGLTLVDEPSAFRKINQFSKIPNNLTLQPTTPISLITASLNNNFFDKENLLNFLFYENYKQSLLTSAISNKYGVAGNFDFNSINLFLNENTNKTLVKISSDQIIDNTNNLNYNLKNFKTLFKYNQFFFKNNILPNKENIDFNKLSASDYLMPYIKTNVLMLNSITNFPLASLKINSNASTAPTVLINNWSKFLYFYETNKRFINAYAMHQLQSNYYWPTHVLYYDYDFRNNQLFELFEDILWDMSLYSTYNFFDYAMFKDISKVGSDITNEAKPKGLVYYKTYKNFFNLTALNTSHEIFNEEGFFNFFVTPYYKLKTINTNFVGTTLDDSIFFNKSLQNSLLQAYNINPIYINNPYTNIKLYSEVANAFRDNYEEFFLILENKNDKINLLSNHLVALRKPSKDLIVTFNAIQKVFRTRFDENRSHTSVFNFSTHKTDIPFINESRPAYESLAKKNTFNYYTSNWYKTTTQLFTNNYYNYNSAINYYFYDMPFLLAVKSDASRYIWFDWFAKWDMSDIQPASHSKYGIYGAPFFNKSYEYSAGDNEVFQDTEMYFSRLLQIRKNYLINFSLTPFIYIKNTQWFLNNFIYNNSTSMYNNINVIFSYNTMFINIWKYNLVNVNLFNAALSYTKSYNKTAWQPFNFMQAYYYNIAALYDILTLREYLLRELLFQTNRLISIPSEWTASFNNNLAIDFKTYLNPNKLVTLHKTNISDSYALYNDKFISTYPLVKMEQFLNSIKEYTKLPNDYIIYKNQYRPMRKGITNMIRLHATGAIAMPIETRIQILASSKDVIHSWAIPSAGIKIDCVPGYSSHKVAIFLVSGIYWGQCMEICGRYHHWMPIVAYFMKRDIFFLWCMHFIFLQNTNNLTTTAAQTHITYTKPVSFSIQDWLNDL